MANETSLRYCERVRFAFDAVDSRAKILLALVQRPSEDGRAPGAGLRPIDSVDRTAVADAVHRLHAAQSDLSELLEHGPTFARRASLAARLRAELAERREHLADAQSALTQADNSLTECVFAANEKLKSIRQCYNRPADVDELISSAYDMSRTHAAAAPLDWAPGNPMRPYPTDEDMRRGWLGQLALKTRQQNIMRAPAPPPPGMPPPNLNDPALLAQFRMAAPAFASVGGAGQQIRPRY